MVCALLAPLLACLALVPVRTVLSRTDAALVLVAVVVAVAAQGYRLAGMVAAVSATVWFDFFLTPPMASVSVGSAQDSRTMLLLFVIGLIVSELHPQPRPPRRAQSTHGRLEAVVRRRYGIGTTLDMERTAQELAQVAVPRFADFVTVDLAECRAARRGADDERRRKCGGWPWHGIRDGPSALPAGRADPVRASSAPPSSGFGAGDASMEPDCAPSPAGGPGPRDAGPADCDHGIHSLIAVPLRARGSAAGRGRCFWRSQKPEAFTEDDLSSPRSWPPRRPCAIDNARRYTRERTTALTLQRSLLPQQLPEQRRRRGGLPLPARAGRGPEVSAATGSTSSRCPAPGSPWSSAMSSATACTPRRPWDGCAPRSATLADVDLPPDELLTHLDDLVIHLDQRRARHADGSHGRGERRGRDLPVRGLRPGLPPLHAGRRRPSAARHRHARTAPRTSPRAQPARRSGSAGCPSRPPSSTCPRAAVLALYTDGLVEDRERDIDEGIAELRRAPGARRPRRWRRPATAIDARAACRRPRDDVALLLARTRRSTPAASPTWDVAADPRPVAGARKRPSRAAGAPGAWRRRRSSPNWSSASWSPTPSGTATAPIRLRLIRDRTLICEVSDASSTAPHLRRARAFDEGGRGLLLVAQLTQSWGTRHTTTGKTIWCEQRLPTT